MKTMLHSFAAGLFACVLGAAAQAGPVLQFVPDRAKLHGTEELRVDWVPGSAGRCCRQSFFYPLWSALQLALP